MRKLIFLVLAAACLCDNAYAARLRMHVMVPPSPFSVSGRTILTYDIVMPDFRDQGLQLRRIKIRDGGGAGKVLARYQGRKLRRNLIRPQRGRHSYVAPVWVSLPKGQALPETLYQSATFAGAGGPSTIHSRVRVNPEAPLVLEPPMRGPNWLAVESAENLRAHHRRTVITAMGRSSIFQRYAIDWIRLGESGNMMKTDGATNEDYYAYGAELYAVADGEIVDLKDGQPENDPSSGQHAVPRSFLTLAGNYVILKIADDRFALYAHMIPGSIRVRVGDRVAAGDVLGLLGNSGNSTGPHLHFQINDSPALIQNEGLPYVFRSFVKQGNVSDVPFFADAAEEELRTEEMPGEADLVKFE